MTDTIPPTFQTPQAFHEQLAKVQHETVITESEDSKPEADQASNEDSDGVGEIQETDAEDIDDGESGGDDEESGDDVPSSDNGGDDERELKHPTIPRKRLNKELEKRRQVEDELLKTRTQLEAMQAAVNEMFKAPQPQQQQEEAIPGDFDPLDEVAHKKYTKELNDLKRQLEEMKQGTSHMVQQQNSTAFTQAILSHQAEFTGGDETKTKDVNAAFEYLVSVKQAEASHIFPDDTQARAAAMHQLKLIAEATMRSGKNVAGVMYDLAKKQGYRANASKGAAPNLQKIEENRKKSASLSSIPATSSSASMEVDFDKMRSSNGGFVDPKAFHAALERQLKARSVK